MRTNSFLIPAALLMGSAAIATSIYTRPSEQLARKRLACAEQDGVVIFDPSEGIKENKLTDQCKILLGSRLEAKLDRNSKIWIDSSSMP